MAETTEGPYATSRMSRKRKSCVVPEVTATSSQRRTAPAPAGPSYEPVGLVVLPATPGARRLQTWPTNRRRPTPSPLPSTSRGRVTGSRGCRSGADDQLEEAQQQVGQVKAGSSDAPVVLVAWNKAETAIANAEAVALWAEVHPDAAVRDLADDLSQQVQKYVTELGLDRDLYAVFDRLATSSDLSASTPTAAGCSSTRCATSAAPASTVTTPPATGSARSASASVKLSQDFGRNIRDDVRSIRIAPERLAGLPEDYRAAHARRRGRPRHHHHRLPRPGPVHHLRLRRRGPPRAGPGAEQRRLARQRPGAPGPAGGAPRDRRSCSATTRGPTTTPRSR